MLASLADSGLDLIAALGTFFAVRYAAAPPDAEHRFGHGKAEAFASLVQAGLVFASAALIGQEAVRHLHRSRDAGQPRGLGPGGDGGLDRADRRLLIAAQTRVLRAHALGRGDRRPRPLPRRPRLQPRRRWPAIAAAALFGIAGFDAARRAWSWPAVLLWGAISVFRQASDELMDHELPDEARARIVALMTEDPRLTDVHQLRTRASGPIVHIQMHADLDPELSLESGARGGGGGREAGAGGLPGRRHHHPRRPARPRRAARRRLRRGARLRPERGRAE